MRTPAMVTVLHFLLLAALASARPEPETPSSMLLRSLAWLKLPGLGFLLPQPQSRTLSSLSSLPRLVPSLSRQKTNNREKRVRDNNNRFPKSWRRPHKLPYTAANTIRGFETFTLEDHIRAKPDVIHYVDSPKIYEKENPTTALSSKEDKSSLYWHKDASNKFIVKRQPGPYTLSSTTTETPMPMVKIVRYDPENEQDIRSRLASDKRRVDGVIMSTITSSHDSQPPSDQTLKFLPVQVGNKRFPLPDSDKLAGKTVKSVVLVLPQTYKLK